MQGACVLRTTMAAENYTGWTQPQSFGSAQTSSRGSAVEIRPGTQEPVPEQCCRARSSGDQATLPLHVEFQVLSDGDHHSGWAGTRAPNSQTSIQVWTRQVDFLHQILADRLHAQHPVLPALPLLGDAGYGVVNFGRRLHPFAGQNCTPVNSYGHLNPSSIAPSRKSLGTSCSPPRN